MRVTKTLISIAILILSVSCKDAFLAGQNFPGDVDYDVCERWEDGWLEVCGSIEEAEANIDPSIITGCDTQRQKAIECDACLLEIDELFDYQEAAFEATTECSWTGVQQVSLGDDEETFNQLFSELQACDALHPECGF